MKTVSVLWLFPLASRAATGTVIENSLSYAIFDFARNHPLGTLLAVLVILGVIAGVALWVVRRVKLEARGYARSGRNAWNQIRSKTEGSRSQLRAVPPHPEDPGNFKDRRQSR